MSKIRQIFLAVAGCLLLIFASSFIRTFVSDKVTTFSALSEIFSPEQLTTFDLDKYEKSDIFIAGQPFADPSVIVPSEIRAAKFLRRFCGHLQDTQLIFGDLAKHQTSYSLFKLRDRDHPCNIESYDRSEVSDALWEETIISRNLTKTISLAEFRKFRSNRNFKIEALLFFDKKNRVRALQLVSRKRVRTFWHRFRLGLEGKPNATWDSNVVVQYNFPLSLGLFSDG
jgi:hypothetical protein